MAGGVVHINGEKATKARPGLNTGILNASQLAHMTKFTRDGVLDMSNKKPYRSKTLKKQAANNAEKRADGAFRSDVPVLYHKKAN